jgi:hypothetical protein
MNRFLKWFGLRKNSAKPYKSRVFRPVVEGLEERQVPTVTYHGGNILPHVKVQGLFIGDQWLPMNNPALFVEAGYLQGFLNTIVHSTYMDALNNAGYGVGRGSWTNGLIDGVSLAPGSTLDDSTIRSWVSGFIGNGSLQPLDANTLYVCFVEPNVIVRDGWATSAIFRGYHGAFASPTGAPIRYAVIAYPRGTVNNAAVSFLPDINSITKTASHEIAEAATDPDAGYSTLGWFDSSLGGEIGDINNDRVMYIDGYAMQRVINQHDFNMTPAEATSDRAVNFVLQSNGNFLEIAGGSPITLAGSVVSMSDQAIDNQGHAMVDIVLSNSTAWEFHDTVGWHFLGTNVQSAKAGQGVSYLLFNGGAVQEYDDATGTYRNIFGSGSQIDAGTDVQGVNAVDIVLPSHSAWENSDDTGWHFIANGVHSISAGRQGISDYVTTGAVAHWHNQAGNLDVPLGFVGVSQVTAGTDQFGNFMIDVLLSSGTLVEWRAGMGWHTLAGGAKSIGKAHAGVVDVVFSSSQAWDHDSLWHFLASGAVAAA